MNSDAPSGRTRAFTLVEMLVVIAIIGILAALLLPVLDKGKQRAKRVWCISNLQQIGLAFHTFANDHSGKFPMAVSTNESGSMEYVQSGFESGFNFYTTFRHFQALSGELVKPELLVCPNDLDRTTASNFYSLQNSNVSYFVGVSATFDKPGSILAGDRNLLTNSYAQPTIVGIGPQSRLNWRWDMHDLKGNILFSDGHVEEWNNYSLTTAEGESPANQSLFMPTVVETVSIAGGGSGGGGGGGSGGSGSGSGYSSGSGSSSGSGASYNSSSGMSSQSGSSSWNRNSGMAPQPGGSMAPNPMPGMSANENKPLYQASGASEGGPVSVTNIPGAAVAVSAEVDAAPVSSGDANAAMSPFDRHLMKTLQHTFEWLYLLLLLLLLIYLSYRIRKWARQRATRSSSPYRYRNRSSW